MRPTRAFIDTRALRANLRRIRELAPERRVMAILKANAYGHGQAVVARALDEADAFGVAFLEEALELRNTGIAKPILLLEGFFGAHELPFLERYGLWTVVHSEAQVEALERAKLETPITVWLKIDTGMHRLGCAPEEAQALYRRLSACGSVAQPVNWMTHFASADEMRDPQTAEQLRLYRELTAGFPGEHSLCNSAGVLAWPEAHGDWLRPGVMLYGISPLTGQTGPELGLQPVMTLESQLIASRFLKAGERIGYGGTYVLPADTHIGVVAVGYGDGYPRHAPTGTPVLINGRRLPIVGRVSMDMITVDLGMEPAGQVGDKVVLWGRDLPVEEIAEGADTIAYELVCAITKRVPSYTPDFEFDDGC
ncbi:MAG: alanine racemase [Gammaproteobacteria bacterium]|nr:alanine racemase [Gammaproteobacteria bacterium]